MQNEASQRQARERRRRLRASALCVIVSPDAPPELCSPAELALGRLDNAHGALLGPHLVWPQAKRFLDVPSCTAELADMSRPAPSPTAPKSIREAVVPPRAAAMSESKAAPLPAPASQEPAPHPLPPVYPVSPHVGKVRDALLAKVPAAPAAIVCIGHSPESAARRLVELALALAERGSVLLVDANPWSRALSRLFQRDAAPGLTEAMLGESPWEDVLVPTALAGVHLLPSGAALGPCLERLDAVAWKRAAAAWKDKFAHVLIHGVPRQPHLAALCQAGDATFLMLALDETPRRAVFDTLTHLNEQHVMLTGCVVYEA